MSQQTNAKSLSYVTQDSGHESDASASSIGFFTQTSTSEQPLRIPLQKLSVRSNICGSIVQNVTTLHYKNTNETAVRSKFRYPHDCYNTAVYHVSCELPARGNTIIEGVCLEREFAETNYELAVQEGQTALIAGEDTKSDGNVMELEIGALGAGECALVTVKEVLEVSLISGKYFVYKYPTSMFVGFRRTESHLADYFEYTLDFRLTCSGDFVKQIDPIGCMAKTGKQFENTTFTVNGTKDVFAMEQDIILYIEVANSFKSLQIYEEPVEKYALQKQSVTTDSGYKEYSESDSDFSDEELEPQDSYSCLGSVVTTPLLNWAYDEPREYFILVDERSIGDFDRICRPLITMILEKLESDHKFALIKFGNFASNNCKFTLKHAEEIEDYTKEYDSLKKSQPAGSLKDLLLHVQSIERPKDIIILSDGYFKGTTELLQLLSSVERNHLPRCFVFGIGTTISSGVLSNIAILTYGYFMQIFDESRRHLKAAEQLLLSTGYNVDLVSNNPNQRIVLMLSTEKHVIQGSYYTTFHRGNSDFFKQNFLENSKLTIKVNNA